MTSYCSECGCDDNHHTKEEKISLKDRITKSKFWNGHHYNSYDDREMIFVIAFTILSILTVITGVVSSELLFPEDQIDYDLQEGIFFGLLSIVFFNILLIMWAWNQGMRIILKTSMILITIAFLLGTLLVAIYSLSEAIVEMIE